MARTVAALPRGSRFTDYISLGVISLEGVQEAEPIYRPLTTILDHCEAPAAQLAALYHER